MKVGELIICLFFFNLRKQLVILFSTVLCVIILIEAVRLFLFGICINFSIEILLSPKLLVILDKTPGLSLTSNLK